MIGMIRLVLLSLPVLRGGDVSGQSVVSPAADARTPVVAERLYNGVDRALIVTIAPLRSFAAMELVLLDDKGEAVAGPVAARPGRFDLAELMPEIWGIRRTCYVQLLARGEAVGAALALQPMLSRLVPETEQAQRSDGTPYTRIVGWRDELLGAAEVEEGAAGQGETEEERAEGEAPVEGGAPAGDAPVGETAAGGEAEAPGAGPPGRPVIPPRDDALFSGLRAYVEQEVVLHTSRGEIVLAMCPEEAPNTSWNFLMLCAGGMYEGVVFHRVVPLTREGLPFVIQAGDPTATGDGGPGYWLPMEASGLPHDFGVISMARAGTAAAPTRSTRARMVRLKSMGMRFEPYWMAPPVEMAGAGGASPSAPGAGRRMPVTERLRSTTLRATAMISPALISWTAFG